MTTAPIVHPVGAEHILAPTTDSVNDCWTLGGRAARFLAMTSLTVTVTDDETGESETVKVADNDYLLIVTGDCHLAHTNVYPAKGTHILTVKGRRP